MSIWSHFSTLIPAEHPQSTKKEDMSEWHNIGKHISLQMLAVLQGIFFYQRADLVLASSGAATVKCPVMLQCCSRLPQLVRMIRADITFPW